MSAHLSSHLSSSSPSLSASGGSSDIVTWKTIGIGTLCVVGAIVIAWLAHTAATERLLRERQLLSEMAAESRAMCEKWGMPAGSTKHAECLDDIRKLRDDLGRRIAEEFEPY